MEIDANLICLFQLLVKTRVLADDDDDAEMWSIRKVLRRRLA